MATGHDVLTGEPTAFISTVSFSTDTPLSPSPGGTELLTDYVFARAGHEDYVRVSLDILAPDGRRLNTAPNILVPILAGRETLIRGPMFTGDFQHLQPSGGVNVDEGFKGEYTIVVN